jgi:hypothetical protein
MVIKWKICVQTTEMGLNRQVNCQPMGKIEELRLVTSHLNKC